MSKRWTEDELDSLVTTVDPLSPEEEQEIIDRFINCRIKTMFNCSFFGYLIMNMEPKIDYSIKTAATDGDVFYYNPYFIKALSDPECTWILLHEVLHAALKHIWRRNQREPERWNYACDYAIHSIMVQSINSLYKTAQDRQSIRMPVNCLYNPKFDDKSAEQIYELIGKDYKKNATYKSGNDNNQSKSSSKKNEGSTIGKGKSDNGIGTLDDHSKWYESNTQEDANIKQSLWDSKLIAAAELQASSNKGDLPGFMTRLISKILKPQKDWRTILAEFIEYINDDYTFLPPDNRYDEEYFDNIMLPSFSDQSEKVQNIIFYIDTSGSIGDKDLVKSYSEIVGAIAQFKGKLSGKLGFFDSVAYPLHDFEDVHDVLNIKPQGGGGTNFVAPFEYIFENLSDDEISGIIILTDGYCDWPKKSIARGKKVLWLINNEERTPPWGNIARLE